MKNFKKNKKSEHFVNMLLAKHTMKNEHIFCISACSFQSFFFFCEEQEKVLKNGYFWSRTGF